MTVTQWIRDKYSEYGRDHVKHGCENCREEIGHNYSSENWARAVRRIVREMEGLDDEIGTEDTSISERKVLIEEDTQKNTVFYDVRSEDIKTLEDLINFAEIDTTIWEATKVVTNKWGGSSNPMTQVKAWFSRKTEASMSPEEYADRFKELLKNHNPPKVPKIHSPPDGILTEIAIFDHHYGQLSWEDECGTGNNYDIKIATELFDQAVDDLLSKTKNFTARYLFVLGNDFFNSDNHLSTTFAGTPQVEDGRWQKVFTTAEEVIIRSIEKMAKIAPVDIVVVSGNHDRSRIFYFGEFVRAWFRNNENISIDNSPTKHKYYAYGNTLIMFTHGDGLHKGALPNFMPMDQPEMFARAKYREIHKGHFHSGSEKKYQLSKHTDGIAEIVLPSLVARDDWHTASGYKSQRESVAICWTKDEGRYAMFYFHPKL